MGLGKASANFLAGGGAMGALMRSIDWSRTPLGPTSRWSQALRTIVGLLLRNRFPLLLWWGPRFVQLYNDAYQPIPGDKHPRSMGQPGSECWAEIWDVIGPMVEAPFSGGPATASDDLFVLMNRKGFLEETHFKVAYSPVPDETVEPTGIGGVLATVSEITQQIQAERQLRTLRELGANAAAASTPGQACAEAAATLGANTWDVPFSLIYLVDRGGKKASLAGVSGFERDAPSPAAPPEIDLTSSSAGEHGWPVARALASREAVVLTDLGAHLGALPRGRWSSPPNTAIILPLAAPGEANAYGALIVGLSPHRALDDNFRTFFELASGQVTIAIRNAVAYQEERERAEALAELDRAKTAFFSSVSHEFRTPLTLMLGPIEDMLGAGKLPRARRELLELVHRNGLRMKKLVNTLLDFSRIEAGRTQATYEPLDLSALTADLASNFRSACERAGLRLLVRCPPLREPVYVDRDMWEKIVLNLVSNAFKFTFEGEIEVTLDERGELVELAVRDSGTGIPEEAFPHLFERFYRVQGAAGRTQEGSGIGLALVRELARLHGGTIRVESRLGEGSSFTVSVPFGKAHLPADRIGAPIPSSTALGAAPFVEEALRWLPARPEQERAEEQVEEEGVEAAPAITPSAKLARGARIVLADDNADMRDYLARLLSPPYHVEAVADGEAALAALRRTPADLVLTDAMMPRLDGFGLLRALRQDPATRALPVIMLSARAGDESRIEGLEAGADDYLVKPFGGRELLARVSGALALARVRRAALERESELRAQLTNVLESMTDGFAALDENFRILHMNAALERMGGMPREKVVGRVPWDVWPDIVGTVFEGEIRRAMRERMPIQIEDFKAPDGHWHEIRIQPVSGGGLAIYSPDVTVRHRAEEALRASEERFRRYFDLGLVGMAITSPSKAWLEVNDQLCEMLGYTRDELLAKSWARLTHPEDLPADVDQFERVMAGQFDAYALDKRWIRKDGRVVDSILSVKCVRRADGKVDYFVALIQDVTERKRADQALRDADRAKSDFMAALSHELRNPLAPIKNSLLILERSPAGSERARRAQAVIGRQVDQLTRLVDDLLDTTRISRNKFQVRPEPLELGELVSRTVEDYRPQFDASGIRLELHAAPRALQVHADPHRLAQALGNLLGNAIKYVARGGSVTVKVSTAGPRAVISVADTGMGVPPEVLPRLFEPFVQADEKPPRGRGGLGLGLALVKAIVELHGGKVSAHSEGRGQGTEFTMELPLALAVEMPGPRPPTEPPPFARRVLVVDDNVDAATTLGDLLELRFGHQVAIAYSGRDALDLAHTFEPEIILCDIGLPDINGFELARRFRSDPELRGVRLVALSGYAQPEDLRRAYEAGFEWHLAKPLAVDRLEMILRSIDAEPEQPSA